MKAGQGFGNFGDLSPPQGSNGTRIYSLTELNIQRSAEEENTRLLNTRKDFIYSFLSKDYIRVQYIDLARETKLHYFPCGTKHSS